MRLGAALCLLLTLGLGGIWLAHGRHLGTLTQEPVEEVITDEFGDEEKIIEWRPTFKLGLDVAGPAGAGLLLLGGGLLFLDRRRRA